MRIFKHGELMSDNDIDYIKPIEPGEISKMPTKDVLERFIGAMCLGKEVTVTFNPQEGVFVDHEEL